MSTDTTRPRDDVGPDTAGAHDPEMGDSPGAPDPDASPRSGRLRGRTSARRWRRPALVLTAVGAGAVAWVGWASPMTLVEHVVVQAPRGISADAVRLASGISAADHVPAVDEGKVRLAVMSAVPAVADVQVARSLPDTIRIEVTARTPLAALAAGKGYYVLDAEGVIFDKVASPKRLPVIKASADAGRDTARQVLLSLPEDLRRQVRRVAARTGDDVILTLRDGATVRWGGAADAELKARVLAGLRAVDATRYDVRVPLLPTTSGLRVTSGEGAQG